MHLVVDGLARPPSPYKAIYLGSCAGRPVPDTERLVQIWNPL